MISLKSRKEIDRMRRAGDMLARCFLVIERVIAAGVKTSDIDRVALEFIRGHGAEPSFLGVHGFVDGAPDYPASACISVNEEVIHGIPGPRRLCEGDIVSIDIGVFHQGYHSDMARTYMVGQVSELARRLVKVTEECFWQGAKNAVAGMRVADISRGIQRHAEAAGFSVVREFVGHGIGTDLHEAPQIPNYDDKNAGRGRRLSNGMTLAIEPMVNTGSHGVEILANKWTVVTRDRSLSAHYENTLLVNGDDPVILSEIITV
jgi:methionyl aminopeptidase